METLRVGVAFPDPPFNGMPDDGGLDIDLMDAIAEKLRATVEFIAYDGVDFNGIFDGLGAGYECVTAGTTVDILVVVGDGHTAAGRSRALCLRRRRRHRFLSNVF